jgi:FlaA1/EpsC-like NDP-sugar epimerase
LRPGEKIYEELLVDGENTIPTYHEKIMIAHVKPIDSIMIKEKIENLCNLNHHLHFEQAVLKMKDIVPEFISNNSAFEKLDN